MIRSLIGVINHNLPTAATAAAAAATAKRVSIGRRCSNATTTTIRSISSSHRTLYHRNMIKSSLPAVHACSSLSLSTHSSQTLSWSPPPPSSSPSLLSRHLSSKAKTLPLPVIDISAFTTAAPITNESQITKAQHHTAKLIGEALRRYGFMYIKRSAITPELIHSTNITSNWFFGQSSTVKQAIATPIARNGWFPFLNASGHHDGIEAFNIGNPNMDNPALMRLPYMEEMRTGADGKWRVDLPPMNASFSQLSWWSTHNRLPHWPTNADSVVCV
jgi:hypothetical protein